MFFGHVFSILMKIVECMLKLVTEKIGIHFFLKKKGKNYNVNNTSSFSSDYK